MCVWCLDESLSHTKVVCSGYSAFITGRNEVIRKVELAIVAGLQFNKPSFHSWIRSFVRR